MSTTRLTARDAGVLVAELSPRLSSLTRDRLTTLLTLAAPDSTISLRAALDALFPGSGGEDKNARTSFYRLAENLAESAADANSDLRLVADTSRKPPDRRWCWFTGTPATVRDIEAAGRAQLGEDPHLATAIPPQAFKLTRRVGFVHDAAPPSRALVELVSARLSALIQPQVTVLDLASQVAGRTPDEVAANHASTMDCAVWCLTPTLVASPPVQRETLAHVPAVAVLAEAVDLSGSTSLHGFDPNVIVRMGEDPFSKKKGPGRADFAAMVVREITRTFAGRPRLDAVSPANPADAYELGDIEDYEAQAASLPSGLTLVSPPGRVTTLDKDALDEHGTLAESSERIPLVDTLTEWAADDAESSPQYCALLGESGSGKTTAARMFTQRLLADRESHPTRRVPIYLDLRLAAANLVRTVASFDALFRQIHRDSVGKDKVKAKVLLKAVRSGDAVLIVDGLDEVLGNISPADGARFMATVWSALGSEIDQKALPRRSKLLVTCRSHYFRSIRDQMTYFASNTRDHPDASRYLTLAMAPWDQAMIRDYLVHNDPQNDADETLATISQVHNLSELASRPVTLPMITRALPRIRAHLGSGKAVDGARLYGDVVAEWLERDAGKHSLTPDHKLRLMEDLAARLAREGQASWRIGDVEQWLVETLADPAMAVHYPAVSRQATTGEANLMDILKEDLRTATFLVRDSGTADQFRFAHTSLREYFTARYLVRALEGPAPADGWTMPAPSPETLDFLSQLMADGEAGEIDRRLAGLRTIHSAYTAQASELALMYVLRMTERETEGGSLRTGAGELPRAIQGISAAGSVLTGAQLQGWTFGSPDRDTNLRAVDFSGADLTDAVFRRCDLTGARLDSANLTRATLRDTSLRNASLRGANLAGTIFRHCDTTALTTDDAVPHRTQWFFCGINGRLPATATAGHVVVEADTPRPQPPRGSTLKTWNDPMGPVNAVAWSPDGTTLATGSDDETVRLWDPTTGDTTATLHGHTGWLRAVAWSPDGTTLATGSRDETVRLWDTTTGKTTTTLHGHTDWVRAVAWSPDGTTLATGSDDGTVRLWNVATGETIAILRGHTGPVLAVAWSPDGTTLATGAADGTVRLWDATTGKTIALHGHTDWVRAVAWSPDGTVLATGSDDETVRLWNVATCKTTTTLHGHTNRVRTVAWSPDGTTLATGSADGTVRLWDTATCKTTTTLHGHTNRVRTVAWSPDGTTLATGSDDGSVRLWDATTGETTATLHGHTGGVRAVAWSPNGTTLITGSGDGTARTWDTTTGETTAILTGHTDWVHAVACSADGTTLATGSADGSVRLWDATTGETTA
ncbi:MAG: pentapeptide repeat-containing protein, partial [Bifidobacteriaceae bacterium]|nr:pentapeptide repeat-containing protein [Bifidobacteriaceae bacterium]